MTSSPNARRIALILALTAAGLVALGYLLVKQRFPVPFRELYDVRVVLPAADGVAPGFGQPVNVAGVKVGTITEAELVDRQAHVTLQIDARQLPRVYRDARAQLRPVTPLSDMRIELDPGTPKAGVMPDGGLIAQRRATSPVPLATLLNGLDADTRDFLTALLASVGEGTADRAPDLRRALVSFGPTVAQLRAVSEALDGRRRALSRLVHNLSSVTEAAADDGQLTQLVQAGDTTLAALRRQDRPLRATLRQLPGALGAANEALTRAGSLSTALRPALDDLEPPIRGLAPTLRTLRPLAGDFADTVEREFRPLVRRAQPLATELAPALRQTSAVLPDLSRVLQTTQYLANSLAYNPAGRQEGMLYWINWFAHNLNSVASTGDAHGNFFRVGLLVSCSTLGAVHDLGPLLKGVLGVPDGGCPAVATTGGSR
ncbi:MlaD family protein [Patulibacter brassicae]|uniref:MlaD family protein n=1 Tax=Patulibacter brassicae TaxID=1705717 RepID=A0ABU4VPM4_9ACTN|nr:MlaD family protein [Patulibacter brassicae]MDX8153287.1 MlaD family protein [Patulibacter brassicae]